MLVRRIIAWLVLVGILAHGAAVVRHQLMMVEHATQVAFAAQLVEQGLICHTDNAANDDSGTQPSNAGKNCPVCCGLTGLFQLAPTLLALAAPNLPVQSSFAYPADQRIAHFKRIRPPGRGPPSVA